MVAMLNSQAAIPMRVPSKPLPKARSLAGYIRESDPKTLGPRIWSKGRVVKLDKNPLNQNPGGDIKPWLVGSKGRVSTESLVGRLFKSEVI